MAVCEHPVEAKHLDEWMLASAKRKGFDALELTCLVMPDRCSLGRQEAHRREISYHRSSVQCAAALPLTATLLSMPARMRW